MAIKTVKLGKYEINLRKAFPLTLRDGKELKKLGIDIFKLDSFDGDILAAYVGYLAKKACPEISDDDVLDTPLHVLIEIANIVSEVDKDFLSSSTSSPANTDGQSAT